jgi:hypothetical protein
VDVSELSSAEMDEETIMSLKGRLAELLVKTAPEIHKKYMYVGVDNKPVVYVKLVHGCNAAPCCFARNWLRTSPQMCSKSTSGTPTWLVKC